MVEGGVLRMGTATGGCFMMMGSADGSGVPWSFSLMSFIAMENSSRSIFPSLFMSASDLRETRVKLQPITAETHGPGFFPLLEHSRTHTVSASDPNHDPDRLTE